MRKLSVNKPETGTIRAFTMIDRQFQSATLLAGKPNDQEREIGSLLDIFL